VADDLRRHSIRRRTEEEDLGAVGELDLDGNRGSFLHAPAGEKFVRQ
jgi:hypothetical protein